jgi:hypothetical protein
VYGRNKSQNVPVKSWLEFSGTPYRSAESRRPR